MINQCVICNEEFETINKNAKYCSEECRRERNREADRLRKRNERQSKREEQTTEAIEKRRLKRVEIEENTEERAREKKADIEKRLKVGDPKAKMEVAEIFSIEYWEAYKEDFMQDYYNKNYIQYVNDISVYDDDFANKVFDSIKERGSICSRLVRNK